MWGYTDEEFKRLELQASLLADSTVDVLRRAGLAPGMHVLDIGCGVGDVSLHAADIVGPSGLVLGVDRSAASIAAAERRAALSDRNQWTRFEASELEDFANPTTYDAVIGRLFLMYQPDPAASVRRLSRMVRPGGVVTFLEMSMPMTRSVPDAPLFHRCTGWILETIRRAGFEIDMGSKLARAFVDGGLATPAMMICGVAASGPESQVYAYTADSLRSLLPLGEQHGVFTAEEAQVDTLADRLAAEAVALKACIMPPPLVGAWTRVPNAG